MIKKAVDQMRYQFPDLGQRSFATTNNQTIGQRVQLLQELTPGSIAIGELCCGDCYRQWQAYTKMLDCSRFLGLDIEPQIVAQNQARGVPCLQGDVLDKKVMTAFQKFDVLFYGPPLSLNCDGHHLLTFSDVQPGYHQVAHLLLAELSFQGMFICICPNTTNMGEITWLYQQIQAYRPDVGLRLIHHSYTTVTGADQKTELRLKYIELWFSSQLEDAWEMRGHKPA